MNLTGWRGRLLFGAVWVVALGAPIAVESEWRSLVPLLNHEDPPRVTVATGPSLIGHEPPATEVPRVEGRTETSQTAVVSASGAPEITTAPSQPTRVDEANPGDEQAALHEPQEPTATVPRSPASSQQPAEVDTPLAPLRTRPASPTTGDGFSPSQSDTAPAAAAATPGAVPSATPEQAVPNAMPGAVAATNSSAPPTPVLGSTASGRSPQAASHGTSNGPAPAGALHQPAAPPGPPAAAPAPPSAPPQVPPSAAPNVPPAPPPAPGAPAAALPALPQPTPAPPGPSPVLSIDTPGSGSAILSRSEIVPGDHWHYDLTVRNSGAQPLSYYLSVNATQSSALDAPLGLQLRMFRCPADFGACSAPLYDGPVAVSNLAVGSIAVAADDYLRLELRLPADVGDDFKGQTSVLDLVWTAVAQ